MNSLFLITLAIFVSCAHAHAQFEKGFVKILEDQRYQDGAQFGNFRNQEDGIKYKEETDAHGFRRGFWEYPDETGQIQRVEFEAGPGIGFRIVNSNIVASTPVAKKSPAPPRAPQQSFQPRPQPRQPAFVPQPPKQPAFVPQAPVQHHQPRTHHVQPQQAPIPVARAPPQQVRQPLPAQPEIANLFDYPADLQFFRDAGGHRFKFSAV